MYSVEREKKQNSTNQFPKVEREGKPVELDLYKYNQFWLG